MKIFHSLFSKNQKEKAHGGTFVVTPKFPPPPPPKRNPRKVFLRRYEEQYADRLFAIAEKYLDKIEGLTEKDSPALESILFDRAAHFLNCYKNRVLEELKDTAED